MTDNQFRFCFTLDTEPDNLWSNPDQLTFFNANRLFDFHIRITNAGARPTYLATSEFVENKTGKNVLEACLQEGNCEVGAHYHSWTRKWPFDTPELIGKNGLPLHAMAHLLGDGLEERMLAETCRAIRKNVGISPKSYRGGRWSLGKNSACALENCGIWIDSTVTPDLTWRDESHVLLDGPDYRGAPRKPYWLAQNYSPVNPGNCPHSQVLELPVGTEYIPQWSIQWQHKLIGKGIGKIRSMLGLPWGLCWLRPTTRSVREMRYVLKKLKSSGVPVWVFMIHSSELCPCTPLPKEEDVKKFVERCIGGIRAAVEMGAKPATLEEAAIWIKENHLAL